MGDRFCSGRMACREFLEEAVLLCMLMCECRLEGGRGWRVWWV